MADSMRVSGSIIIWMASVFTHGRMVVSTEESTRMTKNTVTASTLGLMDAHTGDTGVEADSMALARMKCQANSSNLDCGKMASESNGSRAISVNRL